MDRHAGDHDAPGWTHADAAARRASIADAGCNGGSGRDSTVIAGNSGDPSADRDADAHAGWPDEAQGQRLNDGRT